MTTILKISKSASGREKTLGALREAGIGVVEVDGWEGATEALRNCDAALVVCDGEVLEGVDGETLKKAIGALSAGTKPKTVPPDIARALSHELRTPLSAMAGWLHLMESGKLDAEGMKRAIQRLRGNIDDQVRMIEHHLGTSNSQRS
jgi:signal transduction histidine kinase